MESIDKIQFYIPMKKIPTTTHQEKKVHIVRGKPIFYEDEKLKEARNKLMSCLSAYRPAKPMDGPLSCIVKWCFPDYKNRYQHGEWKISKPDTHNMNKLLFDVMSDLGFWRDDRLVVQECIEKFWVRPDEAPGGIFISIQSLPKVGVVIDGD